MDVRQGFTVEGDADLEAALSFAAERGFDVVELNMDHAFERTRVDAAAVREATEGHGIDVVVHLPYHLDPGSPHDPVREGARRELAASIDAAAAMGAEKGVVHAVTMARADKWDHELLRERIYDSVRRLDDHGTDRGVEVVVENLKAPYFDAGTFPDLFAATDAVACLDTGHAVTTGQDAAAQAHLLREYGDRIRHLHLNESRNPDEGDEHLPVGIGRIDFEKIADAIRETGWEGTVTHEVYGFDREFVALGKRNFDALLGSG